MQPAPWYLPLKIQGVLTVVLAVIVLAAMWGIRKYLDKKG